MRRVLAALAALRDFFLGEDATIALTVGLAIAATAALGASGLAAWWLLPLAVVSALGLSVLRAAG